LSGDPAIEADLGTSDSVRRRRQVLKWIGRVTLAVVMLIVIGGWVLRFESEQASHNLGDIDSNVVMVHPCGMEGVYDSNGDLVEDPVNAGNYNFFNAWEDPWLHQFADRLPWVLFGNGGNDSSGFIARVSAWGKDVGSSVPAAMSRLASGRLSPDLPRRSSVECQQTGGS
jgi:hypothetical protein